MLWVNLGTGKSLCGFVPPCWKVYPYSFQLSWALCIVLIPIIWMAGVYLGYFLGRWLKFFNQFGKFAVIGFTNAAVDFGVLNLLIAATGNSSGAHFTLFKAISFLCAMLPSYIWNKYWAFSSQGSGGGAFEFTKFAGVAIFSILVNDGVASLVVNGLHPILGLSGAAWANFGAIVGSASALIFSFLGFKIAVFKK